MPLRRCALKTLEEKLDKYVADPGTGCWIWWGARFRGGYGNVGGPDWNAGAHRLMYELHRGPIPEGMDLDHLCRDPACVRPSHLEPVTRKENLRRGTQNQGAHYRALTTCPIGHPYDEENTYRDKRGYRSCRACRRLNYIISYHEGRIKGRGPGRNTDGNYQ